MAKVPHCLGCEHRKCAPMTDGGTLHGWCCHPVIRLAKNSGRRWIPSVERGFTSPKWCPRRAIEKAFRKEAKHGK